MSFHQVKIWFQNRRTKWKKIENISNAEAAMIMKSKLGLGKQKVTIQVLKYRSTVNLSSDNLRKKYSRKY